MVSQQFLSSALKTFEGGPRFNIMTDPDADLVYFHVYNVPRYTYFSIVFDDYESEWDENHSDYTDSMIFDGMLEGKILDTHSGFWYDRPLIDLGPSQIDFSNSAIEIAENGSYSFMAKRPMVSGDYQDE